MGHGLFGITDLVLEFLLKSNISKGPDASVAQLLVGPQSAACAEGVARRGG
jgi:hypothetical protein